ncbi:MAG: porin [bacterium]|nr:porin [bacterium]
MSHLSKIIAVFVSLSLVAGNALYAENSLPGSISYDKGLVIDFPTQQAGLKLNLQSQIRYRYRDFDESAERGKEDDSGFDARRVRLHIKGYILDKLVSYKVMNDFVSKEDKGGDGRKTSDLKEAYLDLRLAEYGALRAGQFVVPYSRQEVASSSAQQFVERSIVTQEFVDSYRLGAGYFGPSKTLQTFVGLFNGDSKLDGVSESGTNHPALDVNLEGVVFVALNGNGYDRSFEADPNDSPELQWTLGSGLTYAEGENDSASFDEHKLGFDGALRYQGGSLQGEVFYRAFDLAGETTNDRGFYLESGYFIVPSLWEAALRYGVIVADKGPLAAGDHGDKSEYNLILNRYLNGHALKIQTSLSFLETDVLAGDSLLDTVAEVQIAALF